MDVQATGGIVADGTIIRITGLEDIRRKLNVLGQRVATNVVRRGLRAGAVVVQDEARERAPVRKRRDGTKAKGAGTLRRSIRAETRGVFRDSSGVPVQHRAVVMIAKRTKGPRPRRYAHLVERGTKPHWVGYGARSQRRRGNTVSLAQVGKSRRWHPGAKAQPFMGPAFSARRLDAARVMVRVIREQTDLEISRLGRLRPGRTG